MKRKKKRTMEEILNNFEDINWRDVNTLIDFVNDVYAAKVKDLMKERDEKIISLKQLKNELKNKEDYENGI